MSLLDELRKENLQQIKTSQQAIKRATEKMKVEIVTENLSDESLILLLKQHNKLSQYSHKIEPTIADKAVIGFVKKLGRVQL